MHYPYCIVYLGIYNYLSLYTTKFPHQHHTFYRNITQLYLTKPDQTWPYTKRVRSQIQKCLLNIAVDRVRRPVRAPCTSLPAYDFRAQQLRAPRRPPLRPRTHSVPFRLRRERPAHPRHQEPSRVERRTRKRQRFVQPPGSRRFHQGGHIHRRPRTRFQRRGEENRSTGSPSLRNAARHQLPRANPSFVQTVFAAPILMMAPTVAHRRLITIQSYQTQSFRV